MLALTRAVLVYHVLFISIQREISFQNVNIVNSLSFYGHKTVWSGYHVSFTALFPLSDRNMQ